LRQALGYGLLRPAHVRSALFRGAGGICLVHGDTPTTLLAVVLARRAGLRVAHVEAGLRSYDYLNPFPEELIRVLVMRWSHVLFAPSAWAAANLERMGLGARCVLVGGNTAFRRWPSACKAHPLADGRSRRMDSRRFTGSRTSTVTGGWRPS
jgi:UDP-N-acetylglucosamine 2-epimerase